MIVLNETELRAALPWKELVQAIQLALLDPRYVSPARFSFELIDEKGGDTGSLLVMPGWHGASTIGLKTVTVWPGNVSLGQPSHSASYILMAARSGDILAILSGEELTVRRTAAVSALAARKLMRAQARHILIIGTGPVALNLARCHVVVNGFSRVEIYGRDPDRAARLVYELRRDDVPCSLSRDLETSVREAHVVSAATSSNEPLFHGDWVSPGTHVDLVGSFKPEMREADDSLMMRATSIWVDTFSALQESGDLTQSLATGAIKPADVAGDLRALVSRESAVRTADSDITVFKAVGFALPDLAAARMALSLD